MMTDNGWNDKAGSRNPVSAQRAQIRLDNTHSLQYDDHDGDHDDHDGKEIDDDWKTLFFPSLTLFFVSLKFKSKRNKRVDSTVARFLSLLNVSIQVDSRDLFCNSCICIFAFLYFCVLREPKVDSQDPRPWTCDTRPFSQPLWPDVTCVLNPQMLKQIQELAQIQMNLKDFPLKNKQTWSHTSNFDIVAKACYRQIQHTCPF